MCGSNGMNFGSACCPPAHIFQEQICGNFSNIGSTTPLVLSLFTSPVGDYFEGTFQLFNSAASPTTVSGTVTSSITTPPTITTIGPVPPGTTFTVAVKNPTDFGISASAGVSGTYCITLYKRILA